MTRLLALGGDGIGPAVTRAAIEAVQALLPDVQILEHPIGRACLQETGDPVDEETLALLEQGSIDGVLFGATETRPGEPSAVLALREATGARLSLRPTRSPPDHERPVDVTVARELTEDLYVQDERAAPGGAVANRPVTREATRVFAELAFGAIPGDRRTIVAHKATVLPETDGLFLETVQRVAQERGRSIEDRLVDALAHDLALDAAGPLTILAPNLYGDILSDLTAGLAGGLGTAPSLTLGDGPPIAEPVHGTAPDLDPSQANPTAALRSAALLLEHLGHTTEAAALTRAVERALADPAARTPDAGGTGTRETFTDAVLEGLEVVA